MGEGKNSREKMKTKSTVNSAGVYTKPTMRKALFERIKAGSGEKMNKVGSKAAPSAKDFKDSAKTAKKK